MVYSGGVVVDVVVVVVIQSPTLVQFVTSEVITALAKPPVQSVLVQGYIEGPVPAYTHKNAVSPVEINRHESALLVF